jgi:predicted Rossmann-fold nucleotide-binding protein
MIRHSAAVIIAPGGTGTEWETFEILESVKSKQLAPIPIYIVGARDVHWRSFNSLLDDMIARSTLKPGEATNGVEFVENAADVVERLRVRLGLN